MCGESRKHGSEGGVGRRAERYRVRLLPYTKSRQMPVLIGERI